MSNNIPLAQLIPAIKEVTDMGLKASFTPQGISMRPMLYGGRDEIELIKPTFPLQKYSLPLYVRKNGSVILHRVINTQKADGQNCYTMRGDNTFENEFGITDEQIVAVVTRFKRNGVWHSVDEKGYLLYSKVWHLIFPIRRLFKRAFSLCGRIVRKIKAVFKKP